MTDDPTPYGDGDPVEPTDEAPDPIGVGDHVVLLRGHDRILRVPEGEMLLVHHVNDESDTADCRIVRKITVPLAQLRRWQ